MKIEREIHHHIAWEKQIPLLAEFKKRPGQDEQSRRKELCRTASDILTKTPVSISVVVPVWNRQKTIVDALQSIFNQSYKPLQVVVCDDGSDDETVKTIRKAFSPQIEAEQLTIIEGAHAGVCQARNKALAVVKGDLIAYLDSDNLWTQDYLLIMAAMFAQTPELETAYAAMKVANKDLNKRYILAKAYNRKTLMTSNFIDLNAFVHRRHLYEEYGGFNEGLDRLVDWELIIRYTMPKSSPLIPFIGVNYFIDSKRLGNISATKNYTKNRDKIYKIHQSERVSIGLCKPEK